MEKTTLSPKEAATRGGVGINAIYNWCKISDFPSIQLGRKIIIPIALFDAWLEKQATKPKR